MTTDDLLIAFAEFLSAQDILTAAEDMKPFLQDWRHMFEGAAVCVLLPRSSQDVQRIVQICAEAAVAIVPQGGNTGLAGGATPDSSGGSVVLSLARMNRIIDIDRTGLTVTVEAGMVLDTLRAALAEVDRDLPISFAASGSATLGGILATNAGGANVLRSGMAGRMVLGLEVVLADGTIVSELSGLHKDNSGLNWMQLFVGSEGSLGIITRAVMRIETLRPHSATALLAVADADAALQLYARAVDRIGDRLAAFEIMSRDAIGRVERAFGLKCPIEAQRWLVLIETSSTSSYLEQDFVAFMEEAFESGLCADGAIAASQSQRQAFWRLRENLTEAEALSGRSVKHDISVPVSRMAEFLRRGETLLADVSRQTGATLNPHIFGHIGDGNLHYNILSDRPDAAGALNRAVHDLVVDCGGSITAEHGVGQYRLSEVYRLVSPARLALQERIKAALDPDMILNPGKLIRGDRP